MKDDLHRKNASLIFQKSEEEITDEERKRAKIASYVFMYARKDKAYINMMELHARAILCHCECLGMNAENSIAACNNCVPPYRDSDYFITTQKWGLTNEKGEPII